MCDIQMTDLSKEMLRMKSSNLRSD